MFIAVCDRTFPIVSWSQTCVFLFLFPSLFHLYTHPHYSPLSCIHFSYPLSITLCIWWLYTFGPEGCTILYPRTPVLGITHTVWGYMFLDYIYTRLVVVVLPSLVYIYSQTQYILLSLPLNYCPLLFTGTLVLPQVRVQHSTLIPTSFKCFIKASDLYSPPASNIHSFIVVLYWFFINTTIA